MLRKLILTAVLGTVAVGASSLSFAQGVAWSGVYRATLQQQTKKDGDGKERASTFINSHAELYLNYTSQAVNGWYGTATIGLDYDKKDAATSEIVLGENFNVGLGNQSFGVKVGRTKYLDSVADMGGWVTAGTTGIGMNTFVDDGDLSDRNIGAIGFELRGLPVVVKAGVGMQSYDTLYQNSNGQAVTNGPTDATAEKATQTVNQTGLLVKYAAADFSAGLQVVSTVKDSPTYTATAVGGLEKKKGGSENMTVGVGGNYNLAAVGVPVNLWVALKQVDSKVKDVKTQKDGKGGQQLNVGARYAFLTSSQVGLTFASTEFDKNESAGEDKKAKGTNTIVWVNYTLPWGTTAFATYSSSEYKNESTKRASGTFKKQTVNSVDIGLNQAF